MTTEETQAQLLAQWLSQPPGTDPPAGLSEQVVAAVYSARPDRAPAPRTTLDDILGAVRTGPYAQRAKFAVVPAANIPAQTPPSGAGSADGDPAGEADRPADDAPRGEVVSLHAARERVHADAAAREVQKDAGRAERMRKARRWWLGPMFGAGVAAAAVLLVVGPVAGLYLSPTASRLADEMSIAEQAASEPVAPAAASAPGAPTAQGVVDAPVPDAGLAAGPPAGGSPIPELAAEGEGLLDKDVSVGNRAGGTAGADAAALGYLSEEKASENAAKGDGTRREDAAPPAEPVPSVAPTTLAVPADSLATERKRLAGDQDAEGIAEMEESAGVGGAAADAAPSDGFGWGWGKKEKAKSEDDELQQQGAAKPAVAAPAPAKSAPATRSTTTKAPAPAAAPASAPPPPVVVEPATGAGEEARSTTTSTVTTGTTVDPRAAAVPKDYGGTSATARSDVATVYAAADAARRAGNVDGAVAAYAALLVDADARVAMDAAYRAATVLRAAGRTSEALSVVDKGLARSSANTAQRSQLLVLKGDLLISQGNTAGAQAAWAEASRLNAGRYAPQAAPAK